jgi:hypothetical protein
MSFKWPEGELRISFGSKRGANRKISDLLGNWSFAVNHLENREIVYIVDLLGKDPSKVLAPTEIGDDLAETCYGLLKFYGVYPASEIYKSDLSGGFSSYPQIPPP